MVIMEKWMADGPAQEKVEDTLLNDAGVKMLNKNRRGRGGGVALLFEHANMNFKEYRLKTKSHEIIAAKGPIPCSGRSLYVFGIYVKPSMSALRKAEMLELIMDEVISIKAREKDPALCIAGDFNGLSAQPFTDAFNTLITLNSPPTRRGAALDLVVSNFQEQMTDIFTAPCLTSDDGAESDHDVLAV